jgi:cysteine sulfinate desulfinase/cysteine desulfurase-like protein
MMNGSGWRNWRTEAPAGLRGVMAFIEADTAALEKRQAAKRTLQHEADAFEAQVNHQVRMAQLQMRLARSVNPFAPFP